VEHEVHPGHDGRDQQLGAELPIAFVPHSVEAVPAENPGTAERELVTA